ncbi:hypothetical protein J2X36_002138 [Methylobacterium sp. BE186]|uniref:hypothetical protein n=1 Tax=Methylobacterium sp. BE186 TaxID=2817715 RepID=UPI00285FC428|nr:hypothetical protein [Methylobacterium sp. BE186]MDR7037391.1 hypothetical protein [Methylobacterium sp. BE186]
MTVWLLMQDPHYAHEWRVLGVYADSNAAEKALALLKAAEAPGEIEIQERPIDA